MITRRIFGGLASLLLGGAALLSGGSIASANESADESQSEVVLMVFRDGEWIPLASVEDEGELKHPDSSAQLDSEISPFLLSSIDIWQCNLPVSEHVITTYYTPWNGELMPIDLKCGNSAFGYNHIKAGHQSNWNSILSIAKLHGWNPSIQGVYSWEDLMNMAAASGIGFPDNYDSSDSTNKACVNILMGVGNIGDKAPRYTFRSETVWSMNNDHVITSYPSSRTYCNPDS